MSIQAFVTATAPTAAGMARFVNSAPYKGVFELHPAGDHNDLECKLCGTVIKITDNKVQNAKTHFIGKHLEKYNEAVPKEAYFDAIQHLKMQVHKKDTRLDAALKPGASSGTKRTIGAANPTVLRRVLANLVCLDELPFSAVEKPGIKSMIQLFNGDAAVPDRKAVKKAVLELANEAEAAHKTDLAGAHAVALTADYWTPELTVDGYIGITVSYLDSQMEMRTGVLGMQCIPGSHDAGTTTIALESALHHFGVPSNKVAAITTDQGGNMTSAPASLVHPRRIPLGLRQPSGPLFSPLVPGAAALPTHPCPQINCFGHLLNLVWGDVVKEDTYLQSVVSATRKLVFYYCRSQLRRRRLQDVCAARGILFKSIVYPVDTRWWSELHMLARAYYLRDGLCNVSAESMGIKGAQIAAYDATKQQFGNAINHVLPIVRVGMLWEKWQTRLSGTSYITSSLYPTAVDSVLAACTVEPDDSPMAHGTLLTLAAKASARLLPIPAAFIAAEAVNPTTFSTWMTRSDAQRLASAGLIEKWGQFLIPPAVAAPASALLPGYSIESSTELSTLKAELGSYVNSQQAAVLAGKSLTVQDVWGNYPSTSILFQVVIRLLSIQALSTASERTFSLAGRLIKNRQSLKPETLCTLVYLSDKLRAAASKADAQTSKRPRVAVPTMETISSFEEQTDLEARWQQHALAHSLIAVHGEEVAIDDAGNLEFEVTSLIVDLPGDIARRISVLEDEDEDKDVGGLAAVEVE